MTEKYHQMKLEEARRAQLAKNTEDLATIAEATDVNLENPEQGLGLKERISDLEIVICEIMDSMA